MENETNIESEYIHSFTLEEQQRLIDQALFLEPYHHAGLDFNGCRTILEVVRRQSIWDRLGRDLAEC